MLGPLGFWIGRGLLRGERACRAWALVRVAWATCSTAFVTVLMLWPDVPVQADVMHVTVTDARASLWYAATLPVLATSAWGWWVLMRPAIRRRFVPGDYVSGPEPLLRARPPRAAPS